MKHSLAAKGLSLSQAQSISNLCNQRSLDISIKLDGVNNYSRTFKYDGKDVTEVKSNPLPTNVKDLLIEKAKLHATQAFLMENIKTKDDLLTQKRYGSFEFPTTRPQSPTLHDTPQPKLVDEEWGWDQLTLAEINEFLEAEAFASHIGQFIHKGGKLDSLRKELPKLPLIDWIEIKVGEKTPVHIDPHHTSEGLLETHEELAGIHRKHEQRVNYFKAKVKNLVSDENARLMHESSKLQAEANQKNSVLLEQYRADVAKWQDAYKEARLVWEAQQEKDIKEIAAYRINVPARFQETIDLFLTEEK